MSIKITLEILLSKKYFVEPATMLHTLDNTLERLPPTFMEPPSALMELPSTFMKLPSALMELPLTLMKLPLAFMELPLTFM